MELQEKEKEAIQSRVNQIPNKATPDKTTSSNSNKVKLPPRENESNHVSDAVELIKDKSKEVIEEISDNQKAPAHNQQNVSTLNNQQNKNSCPKCGSKIDDSFIFCDACGYKLK